ncbi:MAG: hypothetical protein M1427_04790 [Candidatus Thermoplasmatota archaeon]|nr:hypothetical protein [Candidatus Thermoplasmatota archaeon]
MNNIVDYSLRETYLSLMEMDKLAQIDPMIDFGSLNPIVEELYWNNTEKGQAHQTDHLLKNVIGEYIYQPSKI